MGDVNLVLSMEFLQSTKWTQLSPWARCIYLAMMSESGVDGILLDYNEIGDLAGCGGATVGRHMDELLDSGLLERVSRSRYMPNVDIKHIMGK